MPPATFDETTVDITGRRQAPLPVPRQGHRAEVRRLDGDLRADAGRNRAEGRARPTGNSDAGEDDDAVSGVLPPLAEGDRLELKALRPEQKFTQPPPRFSEATLVKELEENGIGRPSTYASIIGVLQDREYVNKTEGRFKPSALGVMITRSAHQELRRHHRRRVHAQPRGRSRQDRRRQDRLRQDARRRSTRSSRRISRAPARR